MSRKQRRRQEKIARTAAARQSGNNPDQALQMAGQLFHSGQLDQAIKFWKTPRANTLSIIMLIMDWPLFMPPAATWTPPFHYLKRP